MTASEWAERAARRDNDDEQERRLGEQRSARHQQIKDQLGRVILDNLHTWMKDAVTKYNKARGKEVIRINDELEVGRIPGSTAIERVIRVERADGKRMPLTITYFPASHHLTYECGAGKGHFLMGVDDEEGMPYFKTPYQQRRRVEDIGQELLDMLLGSPL